MKYMGSKQRFAKHILPIVLANRQKDQWYVEPFAGGMNLICEVDGNRLANDVHFYLIEMWKALVNGWIPPKITKEQYYQVKFNKDSYPPFLIGWVGFNCSYFGKWFDGYAGEIQDNNGKTRNYQEEAVRNIESQVKKMTGVTFTNLPYWELPIPDNSIVYCDPPYNGTRKYANAFDSVKFWDWVRAISKCGHTVFISEYTAPDDFKEVWSLETKVSLSIDRSLGIRKTAVEKLWQLK
jgi:DNA adenine methylase